MKLCPNISQTQVKGGKETSCFRICPAYWHHSENTHTVFFSQSSSQNLLCGLLPTAELKELCQKVTWTGREEESDVYSQEQNPRPEWLPPCDAHFRHQKGLWVTIKNILTMFIFLSPIITHVAPILISDKKSAWYCDDHGLCVVFFPIFPRLRSSITALPLLSLLHSSLVSWASTAPPASPSPATQINKFLLSIPFVLASAFAHYVLMPLFKQTTY